MVGERGERSREPRKRKERVDGVRDNLVTKLTIAIVYREQLILESSKNSLSGLDKPKHGHVP